ncbi:MAG: helical backbone metal receptor [Polyangiaceae bacterium]
MSDSGAKGRVTRRDFGVHALLAIAAIACTRKSGGSDGPSRSEGGPLRIVSLSPSFTETLFAIGAGDLLVGRSNQCNFPAAALSVPAVSDFAEPNLEGILARRPTLVVGPRGPATTRLEQPLRDRHIDSYFKSPESVRDIEEMFHDLGKTTSHVREAEAVWQSAEDVLKKVTVAVGSRPKKRIAMLLSTRPIYLAGPSSFPGGLVTLAGGENVAAVKTPYPAVSIEELAAWNPDTLLDATNMGSAARTGISAALPGFHLLRAVRENHVVPVTDDRVLRPGPRFAEGVEVLARSLHAEAFPSP